MLCWLLAEPRATEVRAPLASAELVLTSSLTIIECERVLIRAVATGLVPEAAAAERRAVLARAASHWVVFDVDGEAAERSRRPFPAEPIRTLDAIHLATAVLGRTLVPGLDFLSLDGRCRRSAEQMGFRLLPGVGA